VIVLFFGHYSDSQCKFVGNNVNNIRKFKQESTSIKNDYKHEKRILKWVSSPAYNICILQIWILYTFIILHWSDRLFWTLLWLTTIICLQTTENTYKRQLKNFNINDKQLRWTEFVCCFFAYIFFVICFLPSMSVNVCECASYCYWCAKRKCSVNSSNTAHSPVQARWMLNVERRQQQYWAK